MTRSHIADDRIIKGFLCYTFFRQATKVGCKKQICDNMTPGHVFLIEPLLYLPYGYV